MKTTPFETKATILPFPKRRGRGRPRIIREETDYGTPELLRKRERGETAEALDLCLARDLITPDQHWCGVHLRWLYTLRYGAPSVRALDPTHLGGFETKQNDPEWREAREKEYCEAIDKIASSGHQLLVMALCIYNERPDFLKKGARNAHKQLNDLRNGLDILSKHWRRSYKKK